MLLSPMEPRRGTAQLAPCVKWQSDASPCPSVLGAGVASDKKVSDLCWLPGVLEPARAVRDSILSRLRIPRSHHSPVTPRRRALLDPVVLPKSFHPLS